MGEHITENVCPICNRIFIGNPDWGYKRGDALLCSYSCMRKHDKKKSNVKANRLKSEERSKLVKMLESGANPKQIAMEFGVTTNAIKYYRRMAREGRAW